jgi:hypothetical protein
MPAPNCYSVIFACRLRVALLDDSGAPDAGADSLAVSDSIIRLQYQLDVSAGASIEQKNGCGNVCAQYQGQDRIKGVNLTLELCHLDFELIALMTGASLVSEPGRTNIGTAIPSIDADLTRRVSLEAWSQAWDGDEQATDTTGGSEPLYIRNIFPSTSWREGDREMSETFSRITLIGRGRSNANFGNGPGNDLPWGAYTTPKGEYLDDGELPTATCGTSTLVAS